jgi:pyrroline-5-carboxylate reductase
MAQAIIRGGLDVRFLAADRLAVVEPDGDKRDLFRSWGVRAVKQPGDLAAWVGELDKDRRGPQLLLAVKPQSLPEVAAQVAPLLQARRIIVSILAGVTTGALQKRLGQRHA